MGCSKVCRISEEEYERKPNLKIVGLIANSGQELKIDGGYYELSSQSFMGMDANGNAILIKSDSVAYVEVREPDMLTSAVVIAGIASVIVAAEILFIRKAIEDSW